MREEDKEISNNTKEDIKLKSNLHTRYFKNVKHYLTYGLFITFSLIFIYLFFTYSSIFPSKDKKSNIVKLHKVKKIKINIPRGLYAKLVPLSNNKILIYGGEDYHNKKILNESTPEIFNYRTKRSKVLPTLKYFLSESNCKLKDGKIFFINSNGNVVLFNPKTLQFELKSIIDEKKNYFLLRESLIKQYNDTNIYIINPRVTEIIDYNIKNDTYNKYKTNLNDNDRHCLFKSNSKIICLEDNYIYEYNIKEDSYKKILQEKTYNKGYIFYINNKFIIFPQTSYSWEQVYIEIYDFDKNYNRTLISTILYPLMGLEIISGSKIVFSGGTVFDISNNKIYLPEKSEIDKRNKIDISPSDIKQINRNTYLTVGSSGIGLYSPYVRILKIETK